MKIIKLIKKIKLWFSSLKHDKCKHENKHNLQKKQRQKSVRGKRGKICLCWTVFVKLFSWLIIGMKNNEHELIEKHTMNTEGRKTIQYASSFWFFPWKQFQQPWKCTSSDLMCRSCACSLPLSLAFCVLDFPVYVYSKCLFQ